MGQRGEMVPAASPVPTYISRSRTNRHHHHHRSHDRNNTNNSNSGGVPSNLVSPSLWSLRGAVAPHNVQNSNNYNSNSNNKNDNNNNTRNNGSPPSTLQNDESDVHDLLSTRNSFNDSDNQVFSASNFYEMQQMMKQKEGATEMTTKKKTTSNQQQNKESTRAAAVFKDFSSAIANVDDDEEDNNNENSSFGKIAFELPISSLARAHSDLEDKRAATRKKNHEDNDDEEGEDAAAAAADNTTILRRRNHHQQYQRSRFSSLVQAHLSGGGSNSFPVSGSLSPSQSVLFAEIDAMEKERSFAGGDILSFLEKK